MLSGNSSNSFFFFDAATLSTPLTLLDENITFSSSFSDSYPNPNLNLSCMQVKYNYVSQKALFITLKYITNNLNRFFILPSIILNLCAFYVLQRTRMNRSSSIAFYMQTLALCDVAFFALRVFFGELWNSSFGQNILSTSLCKFYFLMVNAVNYTTVWLIAAMNADKFLAVCLPLRVSDLLSRKKAYGVVSAVILCSMLVASIHASRTVLKQSSYCWLQTSQDEKLAFIIDALFCCFIPFTVISILNGAIFVTLLRARRDASNLHESTAQTTNNQFRSSLKNRNRVQSQNLQITIMLITISITFFVLTLPNAIYYILIFLRVLIESWKAVECDENVYRNLDIYVRTSAVVYLVSTITSDLMHVVNFFLYFVSGARFRTELRRLIFHQIFRKFQKKSNADYRIHNRSLIRNLAAMPAPRRASPIFQTKTISDLRDPTQITKENGQISVKNSSAHVDEQNQRLLQS